MNFRRPSWLSRNLLVISWVSLLQDAASEMLYPILPIFLNSVLGAPAAVIGLIESAAEGMMALMKLLSKQINKVLSRKQMVFLGYAAAMVGKVIIALAGAWPIVMVGRLVDRLGKGTRSAARDTILLQGVQAKDRGKVIGFHRMADTTGAVIGPILALTLLSLFNNSIRPILWIAIIPAVLSALTVFFIKDDESRENRTDGNGEALPASQQKISPRVSLVIWILAIFALVNFPDALVLLHFSQEKIGISEVVGLYLIFNISYASLSLPFGYLADRIRPKYVYALGLLCFTVTYGGLALSSNFNFAVVLMVIYGGFAAANDVVGKSWVSKLAEEHQQLAVQAKLQGLSSFAVLFAGLWAGLTWTLGAGAGTVPLIVAAGFGIAAIVAVLTLRSTPASK